MFNAEGIDTAKALKEQYTWYAQRTANRLESG